MAATIKVLVTGGTGLVGSAIAKVRVPCCVRRNHVRNSLPPCSKAAQRSQISQQQAIEIWMKKTYFDDDTLLER